MKKLPVSVLALTMSLASFGGAAAVADEADFTSGASTSRQAIPSGTEVDAIELAHATNWDDAAALLDRVPNGVGIRYAGRGVFGEAFGASASDLSAVRGALLRDQGALPPVTHLLTAEKGDGVDAQRSSKLANLTLPEYTAEQNPERSEIRDGLVPGVLAEAAATDRARRDHARVQEGSEDDPLDPDDPDDPVNPDYPTEWAPAETGIAAIAGNTDPGTAHAIHMVMAWDGFHRKPDNVPSSWVLEAGVDLYSDEASTLNPGGFWQRPFCPVDASESYFWTGWNPNFSIDPGGNFLGWTLSTYDTSIVPTAYGAYLDYNLAFDDCDRKSVSVGIAYPQNAPELSVDFPGYQGFITTVYTPHGFDESNHFSSSYQLVSNDCLGEVSTNCTGLDSTSGEEPPFGYADNQLIANIDRNYRVPGCFVSYVGVYSEQVHCSNLNYG